MRLVELTTSQKVSYYLLPITLLGMGMIPFCFWIAGSTNHHFPPIAAILSGCAFLILAVLIFLVQKNALKFHSIVSRLDMKTKNKIVRDILREHKWTYVKNQYNQIQAEGHGFRDKIDLRTWSELITISIERDKINVSSICNPDAFFPQALSFGKNKQNIRDFENLFLQKLSEL
jgi:hypothetical protein